MDSTKGSLISLEDELKTNFHKVIKICCCLIIQSKLPGVSFTHCILYITIIHDFIKKQINFIHWS